MMTGCSTNVLRSRLGQRPHVVQVAPPPALLVWELGPQVGREPAMTRLPQPAARAGSGCPGPSDQYSCSNSLFTARAARTRDARARLEPCAATHVEPLADFETVAGTANAYGHLPAPRRRQ